MNKLAKHILFILMLLGTSYKSFSQVGDYPPGYRPMPNRPMQNQGSRINRGRLDVIRENFINRQLGLTPEEHVRFWPLYRQYQQELTSVRRLKRLNNSSSQPNGTDQINKDLYYEAQLLNIRRRYRDAFLRVLSPEKVSILYKSEREFNDEMLRQLSERDRMPN